MRTDAQTSIPLSDGSTLQLRCRQHPAMAAFDLSADLMALAGEPAAHLLLALGKGFLAKTDLSALASPDAAKNLTLDAQSLQSFDPSQIGGALSAFARGVVQKGGAAWVCAHILAHTQAQNPKTGAWEPLSNPHAFNVAFTGEVGAMMRALVWVLDVNFGGLVGRPHPTNPAT